jgi:hypothetical protein
MALPAPAPPTRAARVREAVAGRDGSGGIHGEKGIEMRRGTIGALLLLILIVGAGWLALRRDGHGPGPEERPAPALEAVDGPEALIRAALEAYGGADRVGSLRSLELENEITVYGVEESRARGHSVERYRFPDRVRVDFSFGEETVTQLYDGLEAWMFQGGRPSKAPDYLSESLRRSVKHFPSVLLPVALDERSILGAVAPGRLKGRETLALTLTDPEGDQSRLWFDRDTGLLTRIDYALFSSLGSDSMRVEMSDYREVDGIQTAFSAVIWYNGEKAQETRVTAARYDPPLPDSLFTAPAPVEDPPPRSP